MYRPSTIQHFSDRKSGTIRRRRGVIRLRRNCVISSFYIKYIDLPQSSTFPLGKVARYDAGVALPPLNKGRTPRKRGVSCHCCDRTSEVSADCINLPQSSTFPLGKVARHTEGMALIALVMKRRGESLISPAPDRGGRRRAAAAPGPGCRLPATAKTAGGGRAVRGCPRGWKPADRRRY